MFCKWCGGDLSAADRTCKRCGREVPAASDCGGFYDLVREEQTAPQPVIQTPAPHAKTPAGLIIAMAAGFAVLLVLLIVQFANQGKLTQELEYLRSEIQELTTEAVPQETTTEEVPPESTQELTITIPDLFSQDEEQAEDQPVSEG